MNNKARTSLLQRIARSMLVGLCGAMAIGVIGAVTVRATDTASAGQSPVVPEAHLAVERVGPVSDAAPPVVAAPLPRTRTIQMEVTAYCACTKCCGPKAQGITASGKTVRYNKGRFVAADTRLLAFGTRLVIPGYADDQPVEVIDRGGAIKGNKLDLHFKTHQEALNWGRQKVNVTVFE